MKKLNKTRLFGILILIIGIITVKTIENDSSSFIAGILIGIGAGLMLTGKLVFPKKS